MDVQPRPAGSAEAAASRRRVPLITLLLALLTAVGPISTDMYLPAFPAIKHALHALPGQAQTTLAAWFIGLSVGQITHGPLADSYGRRLPLLLGTALYTLASIGCATSATMIDLSWWRFWAAFGGAASLVVPRAVIADVVRDGADAARMLGRMVMVMGVVPALAPTLGGLVAQYWHWRAIFWIAAAYGAACSLLIYRLLPETGRAHRYRRPRVGEIVIRYVTVWRDRSFRAHALEGGCATFSLFAFLGGAPAVFLVQCGLAPARFGEVFILNAVAYVLGTQANARLIRRYGTDRVLTGGCLGLIVTAGGMLLAAVAGGGAAGLAGAMVGCMGMLGLVLPGAALGSVLGHGQFAGAASALYGTTVFSIGALGTLLVGWLDATSAVPMATLMLGGALGALICDRFRMR